MNLSETNLQYSGMFSLPKNERQTSTFEVRSPWGHKFHVVQSLFVGEGGSTDAERLGQSLKRTDNLFARVFFHQFDQSLGYSAIGNLESPCQRLDDTRRCYRMRANVRSDFILACRITHHRTHPHKLEQSP